MCTFGAERAAPVAVSGCASWFEDLHKYKYVEHIATTRARRPTQRRTVFCARQGVRARRKHRRHALARRGLAHRIATGVRTHAPTGIVSRARVRASCVGAICAHTQTQEKCILPTAAIFFTSGFFALT